MSHKIAALVAVTLYLALVLVQVHTGLRQNGGVFVYPLDDAYIHLTVARNLAFHGVWGITPHGFSGASSSPGWTLLLAIALRIFGVHLMIPLWMNIFFGVFLLVFAFKTFVRWTPDAGALLVFGFLMAIVLLTPLPGLTLIGMEGTLQAACAAALALFSAEVLTREDHPSTVHIAWLLAAFAAAAVRYETVFFVLTFAGVALLRRRLGLAIQLGLATALPPALYALYAIRHGVYALPFSVIVKSHQSHAAGPFTVSPANLITSPIAPIFLIALITLVLRWRSHPSSGRTQTLLLLFLGTALLHILAGPTGWLMRYEAYLYALGTVSVGLALAENLAHPVNLVANDQPAVQPARHYTPATIALLIALLPTFQDLFARMHHGFTLPVESAHDRYVEHLSPALFVQNFYKGGTVVANDIGFIGYYGDVVLLDPIGLGSIEPVRLIKSGKELTAATMQSWAASEDADLAILQTDYPNIHDIVPASWLLVETWCYPRNIVFRDHTISFFAPTPEKAQKLRTELNRFKPLSPLVTRTEYTDGAERSAERPLTEIAPCPLSRDHSEVVTKSPNSGL
jgi:hypothetical protein